MSAPTTNTIIPAAGIGVGFFAEEFTCGRQLSPGKDPGTSKVQGSLVWAMQFNAAKMVRA